MHKGVDSKVSFCTGCARYSNEPPAKDCNLCKRTEELTLEFEHTEDGYPTEATLKSIREFTISDRTDCITLFSQIKSVWQYADSGFWQEDQNKYSISTGGWSGNEDIIDAMRGNFMFWSLCWHSHTRGGHYVFMLPDL